MSRRAGMQCPSCGSLDTSNATVRRTPQRIERELWRGHRCNGCGHIFVTVQRYANAHDIAAAAEYDGRRAL